MERTQLNALLQFIKNIGCDNSEIAATVFKLAADSIALDTLKSLSAQGKDLTAVTGKKESPEEKRPATLSFTKKELRSMPKSFQKIFIHDNKIVKFRYYNGFFQARYRRDGYNIEVSSKDFEKMKRKFIEKLTEQTEMRENGYEPDRRKGKNVLFADYADEWLKLKEQTAKPSTFKEYSRMFETNLKPTFGRMRLSETTRPLVQRYLFTLPTIKVVGGNTLECETSKERMGRNVTLRHIPFTPMFRKVQGIVDFELAKNVNVYKLRSAFKRLFPAPSARAQIYLYHALQGM